MYHPCTIYPPPNNYEIIMIDNMTSRCQLVPTYPCTAQVAGGAECRSVSGGNPVCGSDTRDYTHEQTIYSRYLHVRPSPPSYQSAVNRSASCKTQQILAETYFRYLLYLDIYWYLFTPTVWALASQNIAHWSRSVAETLTPDCTHFHPTHYPYYPMI